MAFSIRPVHLSHYVDDREASDWFLTIVLGMKVVRHEEYKLPNELTACPSPLDGSWCKTVYAFGPEITHFAIQHVYCYRGTEVDGGNDYVGSNIKSLEAIARVKALGVPYIEESDNTFLVHGKMGRAYWLIDAPSTHDPFVGEVVKIANFQESLRYWHEFLGVELSDLTATQFTLFFGNYIPKITCVQAVEPLIMTQGHLAFTVPFKQLRELSKRMVNLGTQVELPFSKVNYLGKNSDYLVILRDPNGYILYFHDSESHNALSKYDPLAETRLEISLRQEHEMKNDDIPDK